MTPFQMAWITATIANRGDKMAPHLIAKTTKPDLTVISQTTPESLGQAIPIPVADQLRDMMIAVREGDPRFRRHRRPGDRLQDRHRRARHRSEEHPAARLVRGVRPADDPQVAVAVMVENGGDLGPGRDRREGRRPDRPVGDRRRAGRGP